MVPPLDFSHASWRNHTFPGPCKGTDNYSPEEQCALKQAHWLSWYVADYVYAQTTVIFLSALVLVLAALRQVWRQVTTKRTLPCKSTTLCRLIAFGRWLANKQVRIARWSCISMADYFIICTLGFFLLLMTVVPQPYYWPELSWGHSPPLATRTGWLGLAPLPFLLTLASKRNPIAWLTNTSHETLQVFHRWVAHFMLIMGLIHTFAFVKFNAQAGISQQRWSESYQYWTGVAMLIPQVWLSIMSLSCFRNRAYEWFKLTHRVVGALFVLFFLFHCGNILTSWRYIFSAVAIYGLAVLMRLFIMLWGHFVQHRGARAQFTVEAQNTLVIRISPLKGLRWSAGQHFFLRFTGSNYFDTFQSHPFTPMSVAREDIGSNASGEMVVAAKVRRGQTNLLAQQALWKKNLSTGVCIDGPYGVPLDLAPAYDRFLLLGGGSGLSFPISAAQELASSGKSDIHLVAVCRTSDQLQLYLKRLSETLQHNSIKISSYATGRKTTADVEKEDQDSDKPKDAAQDATQNSLPQLLQEVDSIRSRPNLKELVRCEVAATPASQRLAIVACGPAEFMRDIEDEVAQVQWDVFTGRMAAKDVWLRSEAYHW